MSKLSVEHPFLSLTTRSRSVLNEKRMCFNEIDKICPYGGEKPVVTISDLDGVFFELGKSNTWEQNIERLKALGNIAKKSEEIVFWTGRTESDNFGFFPFISREKIDRFKKYLNKANPDCKVSFKCGLLKLINGNGFNNLVTEKINNGKEVLVIGSSFSDRKKITKAKDRGNKFFYFDTGHSII
jgi:hypothetical protein